MIGYRLIVAKGVAILCCVLVSRGSADRDLSVLGVSGSGFPVIDNDSLGPPRPPLYLVTKIQDDGREDRKNENETWMLESYLLGHHYLPGTDANHPRVESTSKDNSKVKFCEWYPCEKIIENVTVTLCPDNPSPCKLTFRVGLEVVADPRNHSTGMPKNHRTPLKSWDCKFDHGLNDESCRNFAKDNIGAFLRDHEQTYHQLKDSQ